MGRVFVLAGPNGSGKTSVAGVVLRARGLGYFNPDDAARRIGAKRPSIPQREANCRAWSESKRRLERAIRGGGTYAFETTLGGETITRLLKYAIEVGVEVIVWYVALASPELQLERVRARVAAGGDDISELEVRKRYDSSRLHLIELMPGLAALRVYDNSKHADLAKRQAPQPRLIVAMTKQKIVDHCDLATTPTWAKPILATAFGIDPAGRRRLR